MKKIFLFLLLAISTISWSQTDTTKNLQISVITCSTGDELYSIFGHTAIRVTDFSNQTDIIYNYGTFDFEDPNFLLKFTRGKLDYFLSTDEPTNFFNAYRAEKRSITEQILQLTNTEKANIQQFLIHNLSGRNAFYKYDFLFDNCTTRVRDILKKQTTIPFSKPLVAKGTTFRNMLYVYLDRGGMCWSKLGIDILLGSKIDKPVSTEQSSFLPDYLMYAIDSFNTTKHFVADKKTYESDAIIVSQHNSLPLIVFSLVLMVMLFFAFAKNKILHKTFHLLSLFFIFFTGVVGCLLLFMWFGTDHKSCGNNYNLLWALPTNLIAIFFANKKNKYTKLYFKTTAIVTMLLVAFWFLLPQQFNIALLPFVLMMAMCYWCLYKSKERLNAHLAEKSKI